MLYLVVGAAFLGIPIGEPAFNDPTGSSVLSYAVHKDDAPVVVDQSNCGKWPNANQLNAKRDFCDNNGHCWPAIWLLGAQKAATSAVYDVMEQCGVATGAWPSKDMIGKDVPSFCEQPCKETHWFEWHAGNGHLSEADTQKYLSMHTSTQDACNQRPDWSRSACNEAMFLEGTPSTNNDMLPLALANSMPPAMLAKARFVILLREPVARLLSWYNHNRCPYEKVNGAPWDQCADTANSFDDYVTCKASQLGKDNDASNYVHFVYKVKNTMVSRSQLLLLNYDTAMNDVGKSMKQITEHFHVPILHSVKILPESNAKDYAAKIVSIQCSTKHKLDAIYDPLNAELYKSINDDRHAHAQPINEPIFQEFQPSTACGDQERTLQQVMDA